MAGDLLVYAEAGCLWLPGNDHLDFLAHRFYCCQRIDSFFTYVALVSERNYLPCIILELLKQLLEALFDLFILKIRESILLAYPFLLVVQRRRITAQEIIHPLISPFEQYQNLHEEKLAKQGKLKKRTCVIAGLNLRLHRIKPYQQQVHAATGIDCATQIYDML